MQALAERVGCLRSEREALLAQRASWRRAVPLAEEDWTTKVFPWAAQVEAVRQRLLGSRPFRFHQLEAINCTLAGRDSLVIMPTGF